MKTYFIKFLTAVLALALIGSVMYGAWLLTRAFVGAISAARPEVSAAIIGAMATILAGISAVLLSHAHDRKSKAEEAHRLKKVEIYHGFIDMVSRLIGSHNVNLALPEPDPQELALYLFKFKSDILLWGSPRVIKAQIAFEYISSLNDPKKTFKAVNAFYLAIRDDIGLSNAGLDRLELVKLYVRDEDRAELH